MAAETAHHGPLDQFAVSPIIKLPTILGIDTSITNSALYMLLAVGIAMLLFAFATRKRATIPGRMQSLAEICYEFVHNIVSENAGHAGLKYFPLLFTVFVFITFVNLIGLVPASFAPTSQIIVTTGLGLFMFLTVMIIGIIKQGPIKFFKHFLPPGLPIFIAPLIIVIEVVSYLSRPLSLGIRLAANMTAGHTLIHVMAGFVFSLGIFGFLPIAFIVFMTGFEIFVSILQAYVFTMLCSIYLGEALADHEHH